MLEQLTHRSWVSGFCVVSCCALLMVFCRAAVAADEVGVMSPPAATSPATDNPKPENQPAPTAAPAPTATTPETIIDPGDLLSPGDLVRIRMEEDAGIMFEGLISAAGAVPVPFLGECAIARKSSADAAAGISAALTQSMYQKATISVTLVNKGQGKIFIYGAVRKPGAILMPTIGDITIIQALSYVDGLTSWATPEDAYILRRTKPGQKPQKIPLNLSQIFASATPMGENDVLLRNDDVVCVPGINGALYFSSDACEIMITGEINNPGIVSFSPGEQRTAMRAIFKSGGFSKFAKKDKVRIIQYGKNKERTEKKFNAIRIIDEGFLDEDVELNPGDMIIVPQKILNF